MAVREVASAICRANGGCPLSPGKKSKGITPSGRGFIGTNYNENEWEDYIPQATAAISAMRDFEHTTFKFLDQ